MRKLANKIALFLPSLRGGGAEHLMVNLTKRVLPQTLLVSLKINPG